MRPVGAALQVLGWIAVSSAAGAVIGCAVGLLGSGIEAPLVTISVLFGNVVGLTAMGAGLVLFPRLRTVPAPVRLLLLGLSLLGGAAAGSVAVLASYPLFVARDPTQAGVIVLVNGVLALIVGTIVTLYESLRRRLQESLREVEEVRLVEAELREQAARAELAALQARINPHFFFNTLNTITSLLEEDPEEAEEVVHRLADLFRYTFKASSAGPVALREELAFTRNYLSIERARFGERLRVEWDIDPDAMDASVPGLILQPLVENAVGHGVANHGEGGAIRITARRVDDELRLDVTDDGAGLPPGADGELIREGHGLGNVRGRLETLYRDRASIRLQPNPAGRGAMASLRLPAEGNET